MKKERKFGLKEFPRLLEIYIGGYGMNDMNEKIIDIIIKKADG